MAKLTISPEGVHIHTFDNTREAYDATQCGYVTYDPENSDYDYEGEEVIVKDGDVLYVPSEKVIGFLYQAWPVAITKEHGEFHAIKPGEPMDKFGEDVSRLFAMARLLSEI